jgi:hypothetical protein
LSNKDSATAFVYCDYKEEYTAYQLIAILAKKLAASIPELPQEVENLCQKYGEDNACLGFQQLRSLLLSLGRSHARAFILIDALDECRVSEERALVLETIKSLGSASAKTLVTSRPNLEDIKISLCQAPQVKILAKETDIRKYLHEKIHANAAFAKRIQPASGLEDRIVNTVASRASGM